MGGHQEKHNQDGGGEDAFSEHFSPPTELDALPRMAGTSKR
jgi:hypothetical protein